MMSGDLQKNLMSELRKIYDDKDFVCGTMTILKNERGWNTMLDFIENSKNNGDDIDSDNVLLLAMHLRDEEDKKSNILGGKRYAAAML